jgi:hypothetical protein
LQRVTPLHSLIALRAPADRNLKTPHPRAAHYLFLVLRLHSFHYQLSAAGRALLWSRYGNFLVYVIRDWPLVVLAMGRTRLTPGSFGLAFGKTTGERGGLAPGGTLRGLQFLAQPLILIFQPLVFLLQLLNPLPGSVAFFPCATQFLPQFPEAADRVERLEKQIII